MADKQPGNPLVGLIALFIIGYVLFGFTQSDSSPDSNGLTETSEDDLAVESVRPITGVPLAGEENTPMGPEFQAQFVEINERYRTQFYEAANDIVEARLLRQMATEMCEVFPSRYVQDWVAELEEIDTREGARVVSGIELRLSHRGSRLFANTSFEEGSDVYNAISEMEPSRTGWTAQNERFKIPGDTVRFSGAFYYDFDVDDSECFERRYAPLQIVNIPSFNYYFDLSDIEIIQQ